MTNFTLEDPVPNGNTNTVTVTGKERERRAVAVSERVITMVGTAAAAQ